MIGLRPSYRVSQRQQDDNSDTQSAAIAHMPFEHTPIKTMHTCIIQGQVQNLYNTVGM